MGVHDTLHIARHPAQPHRAAALRVLEKGVGGKRKRERRADNLQGAVRYTEDVR